jgi:hypothetical protein
MIFAGLFSLRRLGSWWTRVCCGVHAFAAGSRALLAHGTPPNFTTLLRHLHYSWFLPFLNPTLLQRVLPLPMVLPSMAFVGSGHSSVYTCLLRYLFLTYCWRIAPRSFRLTGRCTAARYNVYADDNSARVIASAVAWIFSSIASLFTHSYLLRVHLGFLPLPLCGPSWFLVTLARRENR